MQNYIAETVCLGKGTTVGAGSIVMDGATIGGGCSIGNNVIVHGCVKVGNGVRIDDGAVLGKLPMRARLSTLNSSEETTDLVVGNEVSIGTNAVLYAGCTIGNYVLVADLATVREDVTVGDYTIVGRAVAIENQTHIGKYCKLETNCYITAHSIVEDYCFIAPMVTTTNDNFLGRTKERFKHRGGVHLHRGARVGGGAVLLPGIDIGEDAVVGAGSVVTKNVPARKVYYGVPAGYVRETPEPQLLENQEGIGK